MRFWRKGDKAMHVLKELLPYSLRKNLLDLIRPHRPGIGPVLREIDRGLTTIFDIGANVGDVSLYMLHYFPQATVWSFEPCSETYDKLTRNILRAGFAARSKPFRQGFFDEPKEGVLHINSFHGANSMLDITDEYRAMHPHLEEVDTERIPLVRLDDFVAEQRIEHIDLVKIDVEGVEQQILKGGEKTLSTIVDTVILEISFVRNPRESGEYIRLFQMMHDYGFAPAKIYDLAHGVTSGTWKLAQFDCVFKRFRKGGA